MSVDWWDHHLLRFLQKHGFDSMQLIFQPKGGKNQGGRFSTELWDVRIARSTRQVDSGLSVADYVYYKNDDGGEAETLRAHPERAGQKIMDSLKLQCHGKTCVPSAMYQRERECLECEGCTSGCVPVVEKAVMEAAAKERASTGARQRAAAAAANAAATFQVTGGFSR